MEPSAIVQVTRDPNTLARTSFREEGDPSSPLSSPVSKPGNPASAGEFSIQRKLTPNMTATHAPGTQNAYRQGSTRSIRGTPWNARRSPILISTPNTPEKVP